MLERLCESKRDEDRKSCLEWLAKAVDKARPLIRQDDAKPENKDAGCEKLLFEDTERPELISATRAQLFEFAHTDGTEKQMELPVRTMVHTALRVVCIAAR